jgi:hypothetical protein
LQKAQGWGTKQKGCKPMNRCRQKVGREHILIICSLTFSFLIWSIATPALVVQTANKPKDHAAADLTQIGNELAKAVLSKDVSTLLNFGRKDLSYEDEIALKDQQSTLFCYIFDSKCISTKRRSVYEILSLAGRVGIKPVFARSLQGYREGLLIFYDASKVSSQQLLSKGFLCKESGRTLATWEFKLVNGRWEAVTPMFDSETSGPC